MKSIETINRKNPLSSNIEQIEPILVGIKEATKIIGVRKKYSIKDGKN